jgi:hypothetical protein
MYFHDFYALKYFNQIEIYLSLIRNKLQKHILFGRNAYSSLGMWVCFYQ